MRSSMYKKYLREVNLGDRNPFFGKVQTEESNQKRREASAVLWKDSGYAFRVITTSKKALYREDVQRKLHSRKYGEHTEETKEKLRKVNLTRWEGNDPLRRSQREANLGEKNPAWKGGGWDRPHGPGFDGELKRRVRKRGGFCCTLCGKPTGETGQELSVHHIDYSRDNHNLNNLVALCRSCHAKTNGRREYWMQFFREMMSSADLDTG